jgi:hypothetical protein
LEKTELESQNEEPQTTQTEEVSVFKTMLKSNQPRNDAPKYIVREISLTGDEEEKFGVDPGYVPLGMPVYEGGRLVQAFTNDMNGFFPIMLSVAGAHT